MAASFDQGSRSALKRTMAGSAALVVAAGFAQARPQNAHVPTEAVLYDFKGAPDAGYSLAGLTFDKKGAFYGATVKGGVADAGTVFKLTPPAAGQTRWTETVLYSFTGGSDGGKPWASLIFDTGGALYGTTTFGGPSNLGTVFKLTPPAAGQTQWTETVLYSFTGGDGNNPQAVGLIFDGDGALYGTTTFGGISNLGTVFKLTPPGAGQTQWIETVLYSFTGGNDGSIPAFGSLIFDQKGALYGTTIRGGAANAGTVFKLTPPAAGQTQWTEAVLYRFMGGADGTYPLASLIFDKKGALYGTTNLGGASNWGTVFKFTGINTELPKSRLIPIGVGYDHRRCPHCNRSASPKF